MKIAPFLDESIMHSTDLLLTTDSETLAQALEALPDFRVLRRLKAKACYREPDGRILSKGIVIDTETTGLRVETDKVIEIGIVAFEFDHDTGEVFRVLDTFDTLEDPGMPIPPESIAVHGITDDMVAGRRFDESRIAEIADGAAIIIAHNAAFDRAFLEGRMPLFSHLAWGCSLTQVDWNASGFGSQKLEYIAYRCGFFYDAHRADADCRALLEILQYKLAESGTRPLKMLFDVFEKKEFRVWARGSRFETKDRLKEHGYRWDADEKCWHKALDESELDAETRWLKAEIFAGRSWTIDIDTHDAYSRFSGRNGIRVSKVI